MLLVANTPVPKDLGRLLHVFRIAAGDGTTNVAFDADERRLYVSVVKDAKDPKAVGAIVRIDNVP